MTTNGKQLYRAATLLVMMVMMLMIAVPSNASVNAAIATNDNFNRCTLNSFWVDRTGTHADPTITNAFRGDASLTLAVAPGVQSTWSGANQNASHVLQPMDDESFELEVRFASALGVTNAASNFRMQGILVRDNTDPAKPKWLRFDLDTDNDTINYYVGYTNGDKVTQHLTGGGVNGGVSSVNTQDVNAEGTKIRIKYDQALNQWAMRYWMPVRGWSAYEAFTFTEAAPPRGGAFTFNVTDIGVFSGSTGSTPPGHTAQIDYFYMAPQANDFQDDTIALNVSTVGNGSVNWPAGAVCSGSQVTLTASPIGGSTFEGWSGDISSTQTQLILNMTRTYNLTATFSGGPPIEFPFKFFLPVIFR